MAEGKQIILIGDFNAHIEGYGGAEETNSNGARLLELIEYWELGIVNDPSATTLYHNPDSSSHFCVDYTIVSDGIDFDQDSWEAHSIEQFDSDHKLITCKVQIDKKEIRQPVLPYAYKKMQDPEMQQTIEEYIKEQLDVRFWF